MRRSADATASNREDPNRNLRVANEVWLPALAKARAEGRPLTEVIVAYLRRYISTPPRRRDE